VRLSFGAFDGHSHFYVAVIDQETGQPVGNITSQGEIVVSLFADQYRRKVASRDEATGFVAGIEYVLNAMDDATAKRLAECNATQQHVNA